MHTDNNRVAKILRKIPCLYGLVMNRKEERERERERERESKQKSRNKIASFSLSARELYFASKQQLLHL